MPQNDPESLAQSLIGLLKSQTERIKLGKLSRSRVLEKYNQDIIGQRMEKIYHEAIQRRAENGS